MDIRRLRPFFCQEICLMICWLRIKMPRDVNNKPLNTFLPIFIRKSWCLAFFLLLFLFFRVPLSTLCLCSFFYYMHSRTLEHIFIPCLSSSSFFFFCTSQPPLSSSPFPFSIMFLSFALYLSVLYCLVFIVSLQIIIIISECAYGCMVHPCMYMCGCM